MNELLKVICGMTLLACMYYGVVWGVYLLRKGHFTELQGAEQYTQNKSRYGARSLICFFVAMVLSAVTAPDNTFQTDVTPPIARQAPPVKPIAAQQWYETTEIRVTASAKDWNKLSQRDKLANCANMIAVFWMDKTLKPHIQSTITSMDMLKPFAHQLCKELDEALSTPIAENQKVNETAAILMTLKGWI